MKYTGTFLTAALLAAATPAVPARAAGSPPVIDTAYWTEQPYCSGRYQLRLPAVRRHSSSWIEYNGWSVMVLFNAWDSRLDTWKNIQKSGRDCNVAGVLSLFCVFFVTPPSLSSMTKPAQNSSRFVHIPAWLV